MGSCYSTGVAVEQGSVAAPTLQHNCLPRAFCHSNSSKARVACACADGLGIAVDAPYSKELQRLLSEAFAARKVVAAVGRGVAALLSAKITDPKHPQAGMPIVYGKQVIRRARPPLPSIELPTIASAPNG